MSRFTSRWRAGKRLSLRPAAPLKPALESAERAVQAQITRLDTIVERLKDKDDQLFSQVIVNVQRGSAERASIFANELVELRRMSKLVVQARVMLERVALRIGTLRDLGDVVSTLAPAVLAVKRVQAGVARVVPEAERSWAELTGLLSGVLLDAGRIGGVTLNFELANERAEQILEEASVVAEQRLRDKFPELPAGLGAPMRSALDAELA